MCESTSSSCVKRLPTPRRKSSSSSPAVAPKQTPSEPHVAAAHRAPVGHVSDTSWTCPGQSLPRIRHPRGRPDPGRRRHASHLRKGGDGVRGVRASARCDLAAISVRSRCDLGAISVRSRCVLAAISRRSRGDSSLGPGRRTGDGRAERQHEGDGVDRLVDGERGEGEGGRGQQPRSEYADLRRPPLEHHHHACRQRQL